MSNYEKFDTTTIKARIKNGEYSSLVGANRAIGKTQGLSEADRAALKAVAAKHFGVEPAAAKPAKTAKKAAKKVAKKARAVTPKAAKKAAKKVSKKTAKRAKKAAAKPAAAKVAAEPAPAAQEAAAPKRRGKRAAAAPATTTPEAVAKQLAKLPSMDKVPSMTPSATAALIGNVIGTVDQMMKSIEHSNSILPKSDAEEANKTAVRVMERAVRVLDQYVVSPLLETKEDAPVAPTKASKVSTSTKPAKVKGGGRPFKETLQEETAPEERRERLPDEELELTEEEQEQLRLANELADDNVKAIAANGHLPKA